MQRRLKLIHHPAYVKWQRHSLWIQVLPSMAVGLVVGVGVDRWPPATLVLVLIPAILLGLIPAIYLRRLQKRYEQAGALDIDADSIRLVDAKEEVQREWLVSALRQINIPDALIYAHDSVQDIKDTLKGEHGIGRLMFVDEDSEEHHFVFELTSHYQAAKIAEVFHAWQEADGMTVT